MTETVKQMGRDLRPGESRSGLECPRCHGGRTGERSLSVYRVPEGIGAKCHRASCSLNVFRPDLTGPAGVPVTFTPRPYPWHLAMPGPDNIIWDALRLPRAERTPEVAARLGVLARGDNANEIVWEVRDFQWSARGYISRTYPEKTIRVWRTAEGPFYAYHGFRRSPELWVVEDMVSAAQVAIAGGNSVALLGTHFSVSAQQELGQYLARVGKGARVLVALDPDATDKGFKLARELTSRLGCDTMAVPMKADPKDLPEGVLAELVRGGL